MTDAPPRKKKKSGAQRRQDKRRLLGSKLTETWGAEEFEALGAPDLADPATALEYVRRAQLVAFSQICRDPSLPTLERWRLIDAHARTMGMTSNRAELEARTKRLEQVLSGRQQPPSVREEAGDAAKKSPNARGARRGPRALDESATTGDEAPPRDPDEPRE